jgi:hypothetical protein
MSSALPVCCRLPCEKLREVATAHAQADLQAGRQLRLLRAVGADLAQVLVHQVLEHRVRLRL